MQQAVTGGGRGRRATSARAAGSRARPGRAATGGRGRGTGRGRGPADELPSRRRSSRRGGTCGHRARGWSRGAGGRLGRRPGAGDPARSGRTRPRAGAAGRRAGGARGRGDRLRGRAADGRGRRGRGTACRAATRRPARPHRWCPGPHRRAASRQAQQPALLGGGGVTVDVAGKVRRPGVATLPAGSRVVDALKRAGGTRDGSTSARSTSPGCWSTVSRSWSAARPPGGLAAGASTAAPDPDRGPGQPEHRRRRAARHPSRASGR